MNSSTFVKKIIQERKKRGLTQIELAELCSIPQSTIARIESLYMNPSLDMILNIMDKLNLKIEFHEKYQCNLILVFDMYGCPNRCKHCWIGHKNNKKMTDDDALFVLNKFVPFFENISFYSWMREPDYCDEYEKRWNKDNELSINIKPRRFELASFYRIVRDPNYVIFLKKVGVKKVQLTLFGLEETTDKYVGRKGAYKEILEATEILIKNDISPRWQAFINEENKKEIVKLLDVIEKLKLKERCHDFSFFVHEGSCEGENEKLYDIRIRKESIPKELIPYYFGYKELKTEHQLIKLFQKLKHPFVPTNESEIVLYIDNEFNVYFNFTNISKEWMIGNLKKDNINEIVDMVISEETPALIEANHISLFELANKYGNLDSTRCFSFDDYKMYLLNKHLKSKMSEK